MAGAAAGVYSGGMINLFTRLLSSAPEPASGPSSTSAGGPDLRSRSLQAEVAACARELWRQRGCPVGRDEAIWLEAERQVLGADPSVLRVGGAASAAEDFKESAIPASIASPGGEGREAGRSGEAVEDATSKGGAKQAAQVSAAEGEAEARRGAPHLLPERPPAVGAEDPKRLTVEGVPRPPPPRGGKKGGGRGGASQSQGAPGRAVGAGLGGEGTGRP